MFSVHVLRGYDDAARTKKSATGGLSFRNEKRIREHLAENFRRKLSVADLAGVCDLSPGHYIVAFTNTFSERPHRHLINLRLDYARCLLTEGDMKIPEIARLSGFSCQNHLATSLRKHRGVPPPRKLRSERWLSSGTVRVLAGNLADVGHVAFCQAELNVRAVRALIGDCRHERVDKREG